MRDLYTILSRNVESEKFIIDGCPFFDFPDRENRCVPHSNNWRELIAKSKGGDVILAISSNTRNISELKSFLKGILPKFKDKNVTLAIRAPFPKFETKGQDGYLCQEEWFRPKSSIIGCNEMHPVKEVKPSKRPKIFEKN